MRARTRTRASAVETCRTYGWKVGDVLTSDEWLGPRRITAIDVTVELVDEERRRVREGSNRPRDVKTLPLDVCLHQEAAG